MDHRSEHSGGEDQYVTELRERLEDSLKLAQEELQKSQKRYKKHYIMTRIKMLRSYDIIIGLN